MKWSRRNATARSWSAISRSTASTGSLVNNRSAGGGVSSGRRRASWCILRRSSRGRRPVAAILPAGGDTGKTPPAPLSGGEATRGTAMLYSVLDLAPVPEGSDARQAIANSLDLARHAETWGYHRFWLAEHHNMPGIASVATAILIGQVAAVTSRIRVGAG